jgi:hypothetical protein
MVLRSSTFEAGVLGSTGVRVFEGVDVGVADGIGVDVRVEVAEGEDVGVYVGIAGIGVGERIELEIAEGVAVAVAADNKVVTGVNVTGVSVVQPVRKSMNNRLTRVI